MDNASNPAQLGSLGIHKVTNSPSPQSKHRQTQKAKSIDAGIYGIPKVQPKQAESIPGNSSKY